MSTILQTVMPSSVDQSEQHEAKPDISRGVTTVTKHFFCQIPRLCDNRPLILSAAIAGIGNTCFLIPIAFLFQQESLLLVHSYIYFFLLKVLCYMHIEIFFIQFFIVAESQY